MTTATATEIKRQVWRQIREQATGQRRLVWEAYRDHGPCTSKAISAATGISLWNVRPRTTELLQMGLLKLVGKDGRDGVYAWVSLEEAETTAMGRAEQMWLL